MWRIRYALQVLKDDRGIGVVEVILILVVLIGLVIIFKSQLTSLVQTIFEKITSEREMADTYCVNRMTVKNSISSLVEANILYRVHGKGTFVAKKETEKVAFYENYTDTGRGLGAVLKDSGKPLTNQTLEKGVIQCRGYLANKLHILKNDDVYVLHRLRSMGTESFALEYCYVPFRLFEDIDSYNFEHVSLYDYMKSKGHLPVVFSQRLTILKAVQPEARLMKIQEGQPLYYFEYIGKDAKGNVVEYTESYVRCDKAKFTFRAKR